MPALTYTVSDFIPFTKIIAADVNSRFNDIKTLLNTTGLDDTNIQNQGINRSTKLSLGTADHVVINDGTGALSSEAQLSRSRGGLQFVPSLTGNAGKAIIVNDTETALSLGSAAQDALTQSLAAYDVAIVAGEAITTNDAVCVELHNGTGSNVYRVFKTDSDLANRRISFLGFATASASVTPEIKTWTNSAALVASNTITWTINGRSYSQAFSSDNDTTLAAISTQIGTDPDVQSSVVTDAGSNDRVITITSKGGLSLNIPTPSVTGGASQATVTIAQTQAPVGASVKIRCFGPMAGFSGLTTGLRYYLSETAGAITATPTDADPVFVGQALNSTTLFVNKNFLNFQLGTPEIFVRSHGGSTGATTSNAQLDVEHFNFTSWSTGTSDSFKLLRLHGGESAYGGFLRVIDGESDSSSIALRHRMYNKATWSTGTNRSIARTGCGVGTLSNVFYVGKGSTSNDGTSSTAAIDSFNGTSWTAGVATLAATSAIVGCFLQGGKLRWINGETGAGTGFQNYHHTYNGSSTGTDTAIGTVSCGGAGSQSPSSKGVVLAGVNGSNMTGGRQWDGSSWSSDLPPTSQMCHADSSQNPSTGWSATTNLSWINGGSSASTTSVNTTNKFAGSAWASGTSSTNSRAGGQGAVF